MSTPITPRYLRNGAQLDEVIKAFNQFQQDVIAVLQARSTDFRQDVIFTTSASGPTVVPVSHSLGRSALWTQCSPIRRADAQPVAGPWSMEWTNINTRLLNVTFTGLAASTQHVASFLMG